MDNQTHKSEPNEPSSLKHEGPTPGPWVGFVADGTVVCILPAGRPGEICAFEDMHYPTDADANLMIAAPDMLALLIEIAPYWDDTDSSFGERVRGAIAKATGRA